MDEDQLEDQRGDQVLDPEQAGPTVTRMLVGAHLRRLREAAGVTREDAASAIRGSGSKISRMELGRIGFKPRDIADLLDLYGVDDETVQNGLLGLARRAKVPGWWHEYAAVAPAWFEDYLGLEHAAAIIRTFEVQYVPGLLQTQDYARAVLRASLRDTFEARSSTEAWLDGCVRLRMHRQEVLRRADPPHLWVVIDEAALRRPAGGPAVMRAQIQHLIQAAERPHITIQILPVNTGVHAAGAGAITLLRFPQEQLPDVVYLEQLTSALYPAKPADTLHYWAVLNRLATEADPPTATTGILRQMLSDTYPEPGLP